jgi:EAL domain-containing protein (putative c-di-GMP-specific phosphodiesterase class I)
VLLENTAAIRAQLQELRERGFGLAVDDFGTGYSSLAYLKQFHVDSLKIDQMFIRQITTSHKDVAIAAAMIKLAHRLGLKTVAEGVETGEQLSILHRLDCDMVQGHLFSQPLPPEQVTEFVLWWRSANSAQRGWIPKLTSV